ncbi:protocadherin-23-like [Huso huso]|uniref:Protocadherin-23-like n=1 Tax=Huso huso TaxID=61971 RepID=A0ABR1ABE8_HUSHU
MEPAEIAENLPAGYIVTQVSANDVDLSPALSYSFADNGNPGGKFAIDRYTGVITLTESLDYEESPQYVLQIRASDSIHETGAELRVHVLDVNDNPPVFSQESYQVLLAELTPKDTFVLALSTTDRDSGLNGEVSYRLLSSASKGFYISLKNGSLFTSKPLRYFMESSVVQLLVEASDGGDPALTAVTSVEIQIRDINDHAPQFMQATFQVSVSEAAAVGSTVLYLSASDQDFSHENYYLDYSIFGGNEQNRFCIETSVLQADDEYKTVGKLVLCNPLDRENTMNYTLVVVASDRGTPPLNASAVVSVTVIDANDNPPVFSQLEYHIQVSESIPLGSRLTEVSAHDPDEGVNAEIKFHIVSGNDKGHFRLDHRSGAVELNQSLDYEENAKFTLTVQAIDGSSMGSRKMAFAVLFITVLDENDNSPYFMFPAMNCSILENQTAFTHVCSLYAVDHDSGPFGQVTYSILSPCSVDYGSPNKKEAFAIDSLTGDIYSKQTFDYERENRYCFVVQAKDKGDQTATIKVQVDIESVDEFSPVFTPTEYYFQLPENSEVGQSIGQVSAVDSDGGVDGVLVYSLAESSRFFSVNRTSGTVYLTSAVYRKKGSVKKREDLIEFKVKASSPKLDSKSESCIVIVNISNSAEAFTGMQLNSLTISLTISFVVFLLSAIILVGLILRFRRKDVKVKTRTVDSMATTLNHSISDTLEKSNGHRQSTIVLQDLAEQVDITDKKEVINPCRHSGSSGRGSADGDTAEDEEIKMINEHPCRKGSGSALSERASRVPDSGIPQDSDQLSCQSEEADLAAIATVADSSESIYHFKEEGGGEGCDQNYVSNEVLSRRFTGMAIKEKDLLAHSTKGYIFHTDGQSSAGASLTSLVSVEEELRGSYNWDYLMNWEPRFQPLASVFTDIAELQDNGLQKPNIAQESRGIIYPPPLITSVAQPGIRAVPPRLPTFTNRAAFPKYTHSPLTGNSGLTPSAMTPSFSPSLSLLTMQTPTSSPVISETGITGPPKRATLHPSTLGEEEMQV